MHCLTFKHRISKKCKILILSFLTIFFLIVPYCRAQENKGIVHSPNRSLIRGIEISPDDMYISVNAKPDLWLINLKDMERQIIKMEKQFNNVIWSPDSKEIVFLTPSKKNSFRDLMLLDISTKEIRRVCTIEQMVPSYLSWNPKRPIIAYLARFFKKNKENELWKGVWIIHLKDKVSPSPERIFDAESDSSLVSSESWTWSLDGSKIYFSCQGNRKGIWWINIDTLEEKKIVNDFMAEYMCFSPNGKKLLFLQTLFNPYSTSLYIMSPDGTQLTKLSDSSFLNLEWSPNNKEVLYECCSHGWSRIGIIDVNTREEKRLSKTGVNESSPCWLSDGKRIIFVRNDNSIWIINSDGSNPHQIFPKP